MFMKYRLLITTVILSITIYSCKKSDSGSATTTPPPATDTLPDSLGLWQKINIDGLNIINGIEDVWFTDAATGFICGQNFIAKSTDSGKTWKSTVIANTYYNLFFYNSTYGFALDFGSGIAITKDGGNTWVEKKGAPITGNNIGDIYFTSPSTGYLKTPNGLYKTTDTCNSWQLYYPGDIMGLYFYDNNAGNIIAGGFSNDSSLTTTTGGVSWQHGGLLGIGSSNNQFYSVLQFVDANHGWFDVGPELSKTTNGGATWVSSIPVGDTLSDINFFNATTGYIGTLKNIYKTTDGGGTWQRVCKLGDGEIIEIHFIDENTGWACGSYGNSGKSLFLRFKQ
jgi:photosystem II stability/assembly factor-like uncharacterized protein